MTKSKIVGRELRNSAGAQAPVAWKHGMSIRNSNGNIDPNTLGYQYATQTTTLIRARVVAQKFYEVPIADYMPVDVGEGAWMEDIKTNLTYDLAGPFEDGVQGLASGPAEIAQVDVGTSPKTAKIVTWAKGYTYAVPEVNKALASNNWDVIEGKMKALAKNWQLGLQQVGFLGLRTDVANVPGLLSSPEVTVNTSVITKNISSMSSTEFATLVATLLAAYVANAAYTVMPDTFLIPYDDFVGLSVPISAGFPVVTQLSYLLDMFKKQTMNEDFQIKPLAYGMMAKNAGYWTANGTNRYVLYTRKDEEALKLDIPVDMVLNPAGTSNNWNWEGIGGGQFSGLIWYRPAQCIYFDHT